MSKYSSDAKKKCNLMRVEHLLYISGVRNSVVILTEVFIYIIIYC